MAYWNEFQWIGSSTRTAAHTGYSLFTAPVTEPLTIAQAKKHLRVDTDFEDDLVTSWIKTARQIVEADTELALITQTWELSLDAFPYGRCPIVINKGPLQAVTTVKYYDSAGALQTHASTNYLADLASRPPRIGLTDAGAWPSGLRQFQPGLIRFVAGYTAANLIPEPLVHAMRLIIGCLSEDREPSPVERGTYERLTEPFGIFVAG